MINPTRQDVCWERKNLKTKSILSVQLIAECKNKKNWDCAVMCVLKRSSRGSNKADLFCVPLLSRMDKKQLVAKMFSGNKVT